MSHLVGSWDADQRRSGSSCYFFRLKCYCELSKNKILQINWRLMEEAYWFTQQRPPLQIFTSSGKTQTPAVTQVPQPRESSHEPSAILSHFTFILSKGSKQTRGLLLLSSSLISGKSGIFELIRLPIYLYFSQIWGCYLQNYGAVFTA